MMYNRPTTGLDALGRNPQADMIGNEMTRFAEFARNFQGNRNQLQQMFMQVLQSGQITQQDLNMFQQIRNSIAPIMGMMGRR